MSVSPLRTASRMLDASRDTISTRIPTAASCDWIACATRPISTFVPERQSCTENPLGYPAERSRRRASVVS